MTLPVLRRFFGQAAALILAAMILVNQVKIAPEAGEGLLPQSNIFGYTDASLSELALRLDALYPTYRANIVFMDSLFILSFALFTALMLWRVWPRLGVMLGLLYAAVDMSENRLILTQTDKPFAPDGWQPALPVDTAPSLAYWFTLAKFAVLVSCLVLVVVARRKERA